MIKVILISTALLLTVYSIRFNYNLPMYQIQCFHQSVEKDSRYQISIKGDSSLYYLHVVEGQVVHEDSRTENAQYKYYSAFAGKSSVITFCIGNFAEFKVYLDVQFYHGMYLQDEFESQVQGHQLQDLADRWSHMLKMVESNYEIYGSYLTSRRSSNQRITIIMSVMVAIIVVGTATIKWIDYRKMVGFLKEKKLV